MRILFFWPKQKSYLLILLLLINFLQAQTEADYQKIIDKVTPIYAVAPNGIDYIINDLQSDGSFGAFDYQYTTGQSKYPIDENYKKHTEYINLIARSFVTSNNTEDKEVFKAAYYKSLNFFLVADAAHPYDANDWFRDAGCTEYISQSYFLMRDYGNSQINTDTQNYLENAFVNRVRRYGHVADVVQQIEYLLPFFVLQKDNSKIQTLLNDLDSQLNFAKPWEDFYDSKKDSGMETDYSFTAHNVYGRQIYNGAYGNTFTQKVSLLLNYVHGTSFQIDAASYARFSDFLVNGHQWVFYNKIVDNSVMGRVNTSKYEQPPYAENFFSPFMELSPPKEADLNKMISRINNGPSDANYLKGNVYFWRSDMMVQRNRNYHFSVRMTSDRTVGSESGNGDGEVNFYSGAGVTHLLKNGKEYTEDYYKYFNERKFPGTTVEQDFRNLPTNVFGKDGANKNGEDKVFAGGVTDKKIGACGMIWNKAGVNLVAHKSWFMFEDHIVALGAGITQANSTYPVSTTINQSRRYGDVNYKLAESPSLQLQGSKSIASTNGLKWVHHDNVGYIPLANQDGFKLSETSAPTDGDNFNLFTIEVDHGVNPTNNKYAYVIKPNVSLAEVNNVSQSLPFLVVENSKKIQAVYNSEADVLQVVFFEAGELELPFWDNTAVQVEEPSLVMISRDLTNGKLSITASNPYAEDSPQTDKQVTLKNVLLSGQNTVDDNSIIDLNTWTSRWSGQSSSVKIYDYSFVCSEGVTASSDDGNIPENTRDGDLSTRWSAFGDGESIQYSICAAEDLNYVDIAFYLGDQRSTLFDIAVSQDGVVWETVLTNQSSSGLGLDFERYQFDQKLNIKHIKFIGHGNDSPSEWNSVSKMDWGNSNVLDVTEVFLQNALQIVPNPVKEVAVVHSASVITSARLYSIEGREVSAYDNINEKRMTLDFSKFSKGLYIVKLNYVDGTSVSEKIIKE